MQVQQDDALAGLLDLKGVYDRATQQVTLTSASGKEYAIRVVQQNEQSSFEESSSDDEGAQGALGTVELRRQSKLALENKGPSAAQIAQWVGSDLPEEAGGFSGDEMCPDQISQASIPDQQQIFRP